MITPDLSTLLNRTTHAGTVDLLLEKASALMGNTNITGAQASMKILFAFSFWTIIRTMHFHDALLFWL